MASTPCTSNRPCQNMELLWRSFFENPCLWNDVRVTKRNSTSPDFRHKITYVSLWLHGCHNPSWVIQEMRRRGRPMELGEVMKMDDDASNDGNRREYDAFVSSLKDCGKKKDICTGIKLHEVLVEKGLLDKSPYLSCTVISMYAKCGMLVKAQQVLEELPFRDVVTWNALIGGYVEYGKAHEALNCFESMQMEGLSPDVVTFICILKACGTMKDKEMGETIHKEIMSRGLFENDIMLGTALVDMYAKCGLLEKARKALEELPVRNIVSWNALISGYAEKGEDHEALHCYRVMQSEGFFPDVVTFICILKVCGPTGAIEEGLQIHGEIINRGNLLDKDIVLGNALVDMYARCGMLVDACKVLKSLHVRNVVSWSALIAGYAQQGQGHEALDCWEQMQREGFSPNAITFTSILKACGSAGAVDKGKQIQEEIVKKGLLETDVLLGTALVDMYAKCGILVKAQEVLEELPRRNVACWNALITGYAQQGQGKEALNCLEQMLKEGISPDEVTFLCVLSACSHAGLLDDAEILFESMRTKYGIHPNLEHYTCMVMAFGSAGQFDKATSQIEKMPSPDYPAVWHVLLGSCRKWVNVKLGKLVFDQAIQLDNTCASAYILMANTFASAGMQQDAEKVEAMRREYTYAPWNKQGITVWVDASGNVHSFSSGNNKHSQSKDIYAKFAAISHETSRQEFYLTENPIMPRILDDPRIDLLCGHGVNLAIACALINTSNDETIHLSCTCICDDCHHTTSLVSKIEKRKIMIRDLNKLHVFEDGKCGCQG